MNILWLVIALGGMAFLWKRGFLPGTSIYTAKEYGYSTFLRQAADTLNFSYNEHSSSAYGRAQGYTFLITTMEDEDAGFQITLEHPPVESFPSVKNSLPGSARDFITGAGDFDDRFSVSLGGNESSFSFFTPSVRSLLLKIDSLEGSLAMDSHGITIRLIHTVPKRIVKSVEYLGEIASYLSQGTVRNNCFMILKKDPSFTMKTEAARYIYHHFSISAEERAAVQKMIQKPFLLKRVELSLKVYLYMILGSEMMKDMYSLVRQKPVWERKTFSDLLDFSVKYKNDETLSFFSTMYERGISDDQKEMVLRAIGELKTRESEEFLLDTLVNVRGELFDMILSILREYGTVLSLEKLNGLKKSSYNLFRINSINEVMEAVRSKTHNSVGWLSASESDQGTVSIAEDDQGKLSLK